MARKSARDRMKNEVNAGSMADIAFLLLIFFLVVTTIETDTGVLVRLPPWSDDEPETEKLNKRNVYSVLVNANNDLLVRGEPADIDDLRENAKKFIMNPEKRSDMAETPQKAIISLRNDRGTKYKTYLTVYNELKAAYTELRNTESQREFGKDFEELDRDDKKIIIAKVPLILSEAEPTAFGEEN